MLNIGKLMINKKNDEISLIKNKLIDKIINGKNC